MDELILHHFDLSPYAEKVRTLLGLKRLGWQPTRTIHDSVVAYKAWLATADNAAQILDYCNRQMAQLNVVRDVATT